MSKPVYKIQHKELGEVERPFDSFSQRIVTCSILKDGCRYVQCQKTQFK